MRIISLRDVSPKDLGPLFEEEIGHWQKSVCWDYRATLEVIRRCIVAGNLPGYVLVKDGQLAGYSYFVIDRPVAFIGSVYVMDRHAGPETYALLVEKTAGTVVRSSGVERVETQLFEFNFEFCPIFAACGFTALRRHFLVCDLARVSTLAPEGNPAFDNGPWRLSRWQDKYITSSADVIFDSYLGSYDATLCWDYRSKVGCLRFLRNLIENPACGQFQPQETLIVLDWRGEPCGVLLATRIEAETAMIPQISVRRSCQGRGLGTQLLNLYLARCKEAGHKRVALSVSEGNDRAFRLYLRMGFEIKKSFNAYIWQRFASV